MPLADIKSLVGILIIALLIGPHCSAFDSDASDQNDDSNPPTPLVLKNATIESLGPQGAFTGSIVVIGDKISAIGADVDIPDDAVVYDLAGCQITPGLIDSRSKLWLTQSALNDGNSSCELNIVDAIDPWSEDWREVIAQGVTTVYVQPSSRGMIGGYGAVLRVGPYQTVSDIVLEERVAVQASVAGSGTATSQSRHTLIKRLEKLLTDAKKKMEKEEKSEKEKKAKKKKEGRKQGDKGESEPAEDSDEKDDNGDAENPVESDEDGNGDEEADAKIEKKGAEPDDNDGNKKDYKLNASTIAIRKVLKRELPLFVEIRHSDAVEKIIKLGETLDIKIVLDGIGFSNNHIQKLANSESPMVLGPLLNGGSQVGDGGRQDLLAELSESLFSISSFAATPRSSKLLRAHAASAIRHGLKRDEVLAAVTSQPARTLGIADRVGTLEVGKIADIAVFSGDPMDPSTPVRMVVSQGRVVFQNDDKAAPQSASNLPVEANASNSVKQDRSTLLPQTLPESYFVRSNRVLVSGKFVAAQFKVENGMIVSVGDPEPTEAQLFDLKDTVVTPGLVLASSTLGQANSIVESSDSDTSHLRAVDAVDPTHRVAQQILHGGFIHVAASPGFANVSPGVIGHLRLNAKDYVAAPAIASLFVFSNTARIDGRYPSSINGQRQVVSDLMNGKALRSSMYLTSAMHRLLDQEKVENVQAVASGNRRAVFAADSKLEIRTALEMIKKYGIRAALRSSGRVGEFATELSSYNVGLIVPPLSGGEYHSQIDQIIEAQKAGVQLSFAGESADSVRLTASLLASRGVPRQAILKGLTDDASQVVGMESTTLVSGAKADFVVWDGSPLHLAARPITVIVDGQVVTREKFDAN